MNARKRHILREIAGKNLQNVAIEREIDRLGSRDRYLKAATEAGQTLGTHELTGNFILLSSRCVSRRFYCTLYITSRLPLCRVLHLAKVMDKLTPACV